MSLKKIEKIKDISKKKFFNSISFKVVMVVIGSVIISITLLLYFVLKQYENYVFEATQSNIANLTTAYSVIVDKETVSGATD